MKKILMMISGLCTNTENSVLKLNQTYALNIPTLRKFGLFKCAGEKEVINSIASYGVINSEQFDKFDQHSLVFAGEKVFEFERLVNVIPDYILNLIYDVFKTNSLYNKNGSIMQSLKECGQASINLNAPICTFLNGKSELNFLIHEKSMKKETFFEYVSIFSQQVKDVFHEINAIVFAGENNNFYRTQYSKKFVTAISSSPVLTKAKEKMKVVGIGDVLAYVNNECFDEVYTTKADELSLKLCLKELSKKTDEFLYVELGDLEKVYLDKGDLLGARKYLETFDERLGEMIETLSAEYTLILVSTTEKQNSDLPFFIYRKDADNLEEFGEFLNHTYIFRELVENT